MIIFLLKLDKKREIKKDFLISSGVYKEAKELLEQVNQKVEKLI